ncbi:MAG: tRNA-dihydrouridine synthase [bacterium]|nr:tRNA-dihydrouridine synthase [bacterium]
MLKTPFYDPTISYEENYEKGPFGSFANSTVFAQKGTPSHNFLGHKVYFPFGIPAGPIINSNFAKAAFNKGFDIIVYKTVRTDSFPCHPFPNVLAVHINGDLTKDRASKKLVADSDYTEPLSITNSFGVPSKDPATWQEDAKKAIASARKGQVLVLSFMGTVKPNQTQEKFIEDYVLAAKLSYETGAKILEVNLSCPNIGNEGLVCYNVDVTRKVIANIRKVINNTPLVLKIGYFEDDTQLTKIAKIANEYADGIAAINTIQAEIVDTKGNQALPGKNRVRSGVCGTSIKWAGLTMVKRLKHIKEKNNYSFKIIGVGGVMKKEDYFEYMNEGADAVMSATGAMWDPLFAQEIKKSL